MLPLPQRLQAAQPVLQAARQQTSAAQARVNEAQASLTYVRSNTARFERLALQGAVVALAVDPAEAIQ